MSTEQVPNTFAIRRNSSTEITSGLKNGGRVLGLLAVMVPISVLAACGSGETEQVDVEATDTACSVSPKQVSSGTRVTFTVKNTGTKSVDFSLLAPGGDAVLTEQGISPGDSEEMDESQMNEDGTYTVVCTHTGARPIRTEFSIR